MSSAKKLTKQTLLILTHKAELAWMRGNQEKAFQLYDEARKQGCKKAQFICGTCLMVGQGCEKDFVSGLELAKASLSKKNVENMVNALTEHYRQINNGNALMFALEDYAIKEKNEAALYRLIKGYSTGKLLTMEIKPDIDKAVWFWTYQKYTKRGLGCLNKNLVNFLGRIKSIRAEALNAIQKCNQVTVTYQIHQAYDRLLQEKLVERIQSLKDRLVKLGISRQELMNI